MRSAWLCVHLEMGPFPAQSKLQVRKHLQQLFQMLKAKFKNITETLQSCKQGNTDKS